MRFLTSGCISLFVIFLSFNVHAYELPAWLENPPQEVNTIYGVGVAPLSLAGLMVSLPEAELAGRVDLAHNMLSFVKGFRQRMVLSMGLNKSTLNETVDRAYREVANNITKARLQQAHRIKVYVNERTNQVYVLMKMSLSDNDAYNLKSAAKKIVRSSLENPQATHQKKLLEEGLIDLDAMSNKLFDPTEPWDLHESLRKQESLSNQQNNQQSTPDLVAPEAKSDAAVEKKTGYQATGV